VTDEQTVVLPTAGEPRAATLLLPPHPRGIVLFAHGTGSNRHSPRNRVVAEALTTAALAALLVDLLTEPEARGGEEVSVEALATRLQGAIDWVGATPRLADLPVGLFGASTGAAVALIAAARQPTARAVVSRGGRTDLAEPWLPRVRAPVLLIVGANDLPVLALNRQALARFGGEARLAVVPGASHLFPEPGALDEVATLTRRWFLRYLG
jgi:putative phosphoribosyl transferase